MNILDSPTSVLQGDTTLPDALYLRNENGEPIFIPHVRYAEFERYLKDRSGVGQAEVPNAIIDSINVTGVIQEGFAELTIACSMSVTESTTALVRLPLSMKNMNWVSSPKTSGGKTNMIVAGNKDEGVTWWVAPDGSEKYTLSLEAVVKTERSFSESSVRLELPESAVQIKLEVPGRDVSVQWLGASGEVFQTEVQNDSTHAIIRGRGGIGTLVWRDQLSSRDLGTVEVDSSTRMIRSNGGKEYVGSTRLRIVADNRVGPRELLIRLPENAKWNSSTISSSASSHWTLLPWEPAKHSDGEKKSSDAPSESLAREVLQLQLSDRGRSFIDEIPIEWTMAVEDPSSGSFAVTGIEVEGVQRHEGHLSIVMPASTQLSWLPSSEYSLVKQSPPNDVSDSIEYDFKFTRQPIRLQAVLSEDESQVRWRPDYLVTLDQDAMRLQGVLTFPADPSQWIGLKVVLGAWRFDTAVWDKTGELIQIETGDGNTLRFNSKNILAIAEAGQDGSLSSKPPIAIRFSAYQSIATADMIRMGFQLPQISTVLNGKRKNERGNGSLVVDLGTWKIEPSEFRTTGIARTSDSPASLRTLLADRNTSELQIFRFQTNGPDVKWTARAQRSSRNISATMTTNVSIHTEEWRCTRQWTIQSVGQSLDRLLLRIPAAWTKIEEATGVEVVSDRVTFSSGGIPLDVQVVQSDLDGWSIIEAVKTSWPDTFDLDVSYRESIAPQAIVSETPGPSKPSDSIRIFLPQLAVEPSAKILDFHTTIEAGPNLLCTVQQAATVPIVCTKQDRQVSIPLSETSESLDVAIRPWVSAKENEVDVQGVWLQTVINSEQRRERCVMRIKTKQSSLTFKLPEGWSETSTSLIVNNRKQSLEHDIETGVYRLVIPRTETFKSSINPLLNEQSTNSTDGDSKSVVVEFWNWSSQTRDWSNSLEVRLPIMLGSAGTAPLTWLLVVPKTEHLWTSSSTLLSDQRWEWRNLGWRRQVNTTQQQLEAEFGASPQPVIASQTNQYVLKSIGSIGEHPGESIGSIRVIPRFVLWLPVATIVLMLTALWPRMGVFRHPWMLLAVVVFLSLLSMTAPDMTILLVQAAIASLLIVGLVKLLSWASRQRVRRRSVFANRPTAISAPRPSARVNVDDSRGTQPRMEDAGSVLTPSTHAMDAALPSPITEIRS